MRLYNPKNGKEFVTASDDEAHVAVYLDAGLEPAPEPTARPGFEPEPTVYAPVEPEPEPKSKSRAKRATKSAEPAGEDESTS